MIVLDDVDVDVCGWIDECELELIIGVINVNVKEGKCEGKYEGKCECEYECKCKM